MSDREGLVQSLSKHIKVDVYGQCGKLKCDGQEECYQMVNRSYKFYLSLENSVCQVGQVSVKYISIPLCLRTTSQRSSSTFCPTT